MERTLEKGALIRSRNIAVKRGAITGKRTADFFAAKSKTLNFEIKFQVLFEMSNALGVRFQSNFSASSASASSQRPISAVMMPKIPT